MDLPARLLITGANGRLGRGLIARLSGKLPVRAVVRSEAARRQVLEGSHPADLDHADLDCVVLDYADVEALTAAANGCSHAVHLVGIIKESANTSFVDAHENSTRALAAAAQRAGVERIVYMSILGADASHPNVCLASKARAENVLLGAPVPTLVLRVPMVLGAGDPAARALEARARSRFVVLLRGESREQPIYTNDIVNALVAALDREAGVGVLELAGPESLSREALVRRASKRFGTTPRIVSLPLSVGLAAAYVLERLSANPPVSRAMLGVLDHDDHVDPAPACRRLGIELTPLDTMLERCFRTDLTRSAR